MSGLILPPSLGIMAIDRKMPDVLAGEMLCDGCWAVSGPPPFLGWMSFAFKHLKTTNICPQCVPVEARGLKEKQAAGL